MPDLNFTAEQLAEFFKYLDELRESGRTNMFGATPYLRNEFDMDRRGSEAVLSAWMETFSHEHSPIARARGALLRKQEGQ